MRAFAVETAFEGSSSANQRAYVSSTALSLRAKRVQCGPMYRWECTDNIAIYSLAADAQTVQNLYIRLSYNASGQRHKGPIVAELFSDDDLAREDRATERDARVCEADEQAWTPRAPRAYRRNLGLSETVFGNACSGRDGRRLTRPGGLAVWGVSLSFICHNWYTVTRECLIHPYNRFQRKSIGTQAVSDWDIPEIMIRETWQLTTWTHKPWRFR